MVQYLPMIAQIITTITILTLLYANYCARQALRAQRESTLTLLQSHQEALSDGLTALAENARLKDEIAKLRQEPPPTASELEYVYQSLGAVPPPTVQDSIRERDEVLDSIMNDLDAMSGEW